MTTLEALERERQATLKAIVSSDNGKGKDSQERRQQLAKDLTSFGALVLDEKTQVCKSVQEACAAPSSAAVRLELSYRTLSTLPAEACLSNLAELSLVGNDLEALPDALSHCRKLRSLALGANRLKVLPDLAQVPLLHLGMGCNDVDDSSLPVLLSGLPSKLASFDLSTNGLCHLDATLHQLQALRALRHLTLAGNPLCVRRGYRKAVLATASGGRLALLDGTPVADTSADDAPEPDTPAGGDEAAAAEGEEGAPAAAEPAEAAGAEEKVALRFALTSLEGLKVKKRPEGEAEGEAPPPEMITVEFELLGETRATEPAAWGEKVELNATFDVTPPRGVELRTALLVRGLAFRVMLQPHPKEPAEGEAAAEGEPTAEEPAEPTLVGAITSKWGPILDGVATCTQTCSATIAPPAPPRKPGRKAKKPPSPFTLTLGVSCTMLP